MKDLVLLFLIIIFLLIIYFKPSVLENWDLYKTKHYKYIKTGSKSINLYQHKLYRKPYRHPFHFVKTYPMPHLSHFN